MWLSQGAQKLIRRILDPNPIFRATMESIKIDHWFSKDYHPPNFYDEDQEDIYVAISTNQEVRPVNYS